MQAYIRSRDVDKQRIEDAIQAIEGVDNVIPALRQKPLNYKGKKSECIASPVIAKLVPRGSHMAEPFAGSGSFCIAGLDAGMQVVACELEPYAHDAVRVLLEKCDIAKADMMFQAIKDECYPDILHLYRTECHDVPNYIDKLHFDPESERDPSIPEYHHPKEHRDITDGKTITMMKACPVCHQKKKKFAKLDETVIGEAKALDTIDFPHHSLMENSRINITPANGAGNYDRNYTKRAQYALLRIQQAIDKQPPGRERDLLQHALVSSLTLSRIAQYGSGSEYIYQVMRMQAQEKNVWAVFESKYASFKQFKKGYASVQLDSISRPGSPLRLLRGDYSEILSAPEYKEKFQLVYTDPPYTDQVPYLERAQLFRDWLKIFYDDSFQLTEEMLNAEMVITNAPSRSMDTPKQKEKLSYGQYCRDIDKMFRLFYQILEPNGLVVLTVNLGTNKYLKTLAEFINLAQKNGFECARRQNLDKNNPTLRKQAAWANTISKEMLVFFTKLGEDKRYWYEGDTNFDFEIVYNVYHAIKASRDARIPLTEAVALMEGILMKKHGRIAGADDITRLTEHICLEFFVDNGFVYLYSTRLYLGVENNEQLFSKLLDMMPILIHELVGINGEYSFELEDLYTRMAEKLLNGDSNTLSQILSDENHEEDITGILLTYCDKGEKGYTLKKYNSTDGTPRIGIDVSAMEGYDFEALIARLLESQGFDNIILAGGAGDRGVDIWADRLVNGQRERHVIQCKRWVNNVSGTPIQRLHSMMVQTEGVTHAACYTTSDYTKDAHKESRGTGVELINGQELMNQLNEAFPGQYYNTLLDRIKKPHQ